MILSTARVWGDWPLSLLALAMVLSLLTVPAERAGAQESSNDLSVVKDNEAPSNAEIARRLSEATSLASVDRVIISRDDEFADALAAGLMQASSPLLLVPSSGPVSPRVQAEIERLGANSAVILGGTNAVGEAVDTQLTGSGLSVERRQGGSRIETAVDIARNEAPDATTAIIARAFSADPANPTQAFADALGAGALSAENTWPILLSQTEQLTAATRDYLADSRVTEVRLVGGTAALSAGVEQDLRDMGIATTRIAGANRGETAVEIAKSQGADSAADVSHVILVDGTSEDGWAGGFASAGRAALLDAPILLVDGVRLMPETAEFLTPGTSFAQAGELTVTCVVHPLACTEGRRALGLSDYPLLSLDPLRGEVVQPGQQVTATLTPAVEAADGEILFDGSCVAGATQLQTVDEAGQAQVTLASSFADPACQLNVTYEGDAGAVLRTSTAYVTQGAPFRTADQALVSSGIVVYGDTVPLTPVYVNDTITCTPPGESPVARDGFAYTAQFQQEGSPALDVVSNGSDQVITSRDASCTASITPPTQTSRVFWGIYSQTDSGLRIPLALGNGTSAAFDLAQLDSAAGADLSDLSVTWVLQNDDPRPLAPEPPPAGVEGVLSNPDGLPIICDGQLVGDGVRQLPVGANCTLEELSHEFNYLLIQPNRDIISAPNLTFETLADPRPTQVRLQFLFDPRPAPTGPGNSACQIAQPLILGQQSAGTLARAGTSAFHSIEISEGQDVRVRVNNPFGSDSDGLDPITRVLDADGNEVAMNDDEVVGILLGSRIDTFLDAGSYCLEVSGFGDTFGDYLIAVDPFPVFTQQVSSTPEDPNSFFTYTGEQGDLLVLEARQVTDDGTDPFLGVFNEDGTQTLASDDDSGGFPNARIELVMPYTGTITVGVGTFDDSGGDVVYEASSPTGTASFAEVDSGTADATGSAALADAMRTVGSNF